MTYFQGAEEHKADCVVGSRAERRLKSCGPASAEQTPPLNAAFTILNAAFTSPGWPGPQAKPR